MKQRLIGCIALAVMICSCASKQVAPPPVIAPSPEELKMAKNLPLEISKPVEVGSGIAGVANLATEIAEGKTLYENNCARCHRLFGTKEFTKDQWKPLVLSMQKNASLDDFQTAKIIRYVTSDSN